MRILLVEDEFLVAVQVKEDLYAAGYFVVGPFARVDAAIHASRREAFDLAVLDINLNGQPVYPLADELSRRDTPFIFLTGYGTIDMPERFRSSPRVGKPYDPKALIQQIRTIAE